MLDNYEKFIPETEEVRSGFKVSSNRKKVWNVQLGLLEELKRICRKHNIKYYADGGTLLGAIRHEGYIPWDDDLDVVMFREDYEKFLSVVKKELPKHVELGTYYGQFYKLVNTNTAALCDDYTGGIRIDIFCIDYASKFMIINWAKCKILDFLSLILILQKRERAIDKVKKRKIPFVYILKFTLTLCKFNYSKTQQLRENINKIVLCKGNNIYTSGCVHNFYPKDIYDKSHIGKFENTTINIADGYDTFLKILYGNYMVPVIRQGGHNCRFSVDKSYKNIIKTFDKSKSNEENCKNCKSLFVL